MDMLVWDQLFICNVKAYIACGGMSKKKATEDFYFLQALSKYSPIFTIEDVLVFPSSRVTNRVYLGTGFRMQEYKSTKQFTNLMFSSKSFKCLKEIITIANITWNKDFYYFSEKYTQKAR